MGAHIADPEHCSDASSHCELVSPASWYIVRGGAISSCQDHATEIQYERSGEPTRVLNGTGLVAFPVFEMCPPYLISSSNICLRSTQSTTQSLRRDRSHASLCISPFFRYANRTSVGLLNRSTGGNIRKCGDSNSKILERDKHPAC